MFHKVSMSADYLETKNSRSSLYKRFHCTLGGKIFDGDSVFIFLKNIYTAIPTLQNSKPVLSVYNIIVSKKVK